MVFAIDCPTHGQRILVTAARIRGLRNTSGRILLDVECWCGTRVTIHTGRRAAGPDPNTPDTAGPDPNTPHSAGQGSNL